MGSVLLVGVCAFLFYKRHELRVKDVHSKFFKTAPEPERAHPMWLADEAPDVVVVPLSSSADDSNRMGAGAYMVHGKTGYHHENLPSERANGETDLSICALETNLHYRGMHAPSEVDAPVSTVFGTPGIVAVTTTDSDDANSHASAVSQLHTSTRYTSSSDGNEEVSSDSSSDDSSDATEESSMYMTQDSAPSSPRSSVRLSSFDGFGAGARSRGSSFHTGVHQGHIRSRGSSFHTVRRRFASSFDSVYEEILRTKGEDAV